MVQRKLFGMVEWILGVEGAWAEFVRRICEGLAGESDDARCDELTFILRTALEED